MLTQDKWRNLCKLAKNPDKARTTKLTLSQIERILEVQDLVAKIRAS